MSAHAPSASAAGLALGGADHRAAARPRLARPCSGPARTRLLQASRAARRGSKASAVGSRSEPDAAAARITTPSGSATAARPFFLLERRLQAQPFVDRRRGVLAVLQRHRRRRGGAPRLERALRGHGEREGNLGERARDRRPASSAIGVFAYSRTVAAPSCESRDDVRVGGGRRLDLERHAGKRGVLVARDEGFPYIDPARVRLRLDDERRSRKRQNVDSTSVVGGEHRAARPRDDGDRRLASVVEKRSTPRPPRRRARRRAPREMSPRRSFRNRHRARRRIRRRDRRRQRGPAGSCASGSKKPKRRPAPRPAHGVDDAAVRVGAAGGLERARDGAVAVAPRLGDGAHEDRRTPRRRGRSNTSATAPRARARAGGLGDQRVRRRSRSPNPGTAGRVTAPSEECTPRRRAPRAEPPSRSATASANAAKAAPWSPSRPALFVRVLVAVGSALWRGERHRRR